MIGIKENMKKCSSCFVDKALTEFNNASISSGKQSMCKECHKAYQKVWREARKAQQVVLDVQSKVCLHCKSEKPVSQFGKRSVSLDKRNQYCRECWRVMSYKAQKKFKAKNA
jgi:hypothetical protein